MVATKKGTGEILLEKCMEEDIFLQEIKGEVYLKKRLLNCNKNGKV